MHKCISGYQQQVPVYYGGILPVGQQRHAELTCDVPHSSSFYSCCCRWCSHSHAYALLRSLIAPPAPPAPPVPPASPACRSTSAAAPPNGRRAAAGAVCRPEPAARRPRASAAIRGRRWSGFGAPDLALVEPRDALVPLASGMLGSSVGECPDPFNSHFL